MIGVRRKRGFLTSTVSFLALTLASTSASAEEPKTFDIEEQALAKALITFNEQSGLTVAAPRNLVEGKVSPAIHGNMEPAEALDRILTNSGLKATKLSNGAYTVTLPTAAQADRSGNFRVAYLQPAEPSQPTQPPEPQESSVALDDSPTLEEIVTTGSRLRRDTTTTPMPINVVDSEQITLTFEQNIGEVLLEQPQFTPGSNQQTGRNTTSAGAGLNLANLRAMGVERTLVLVNGRRRVGSGGLSTAVDLNTIPSNLIERVDIVTGGASSIYGADAVSGAVNIILKDDFQGFRLDGQAGITDNGDGESGNINFLAGTNFDDGRGNVTVSFVYDDSSRVRATARDFGNNGRTFVSNPNFGETGEPRNIHKDDVSFFFATKPGDFFIPGMFVDDQGRNINGIFQDDGSVARQFNFGDGEFFDVGFNTGSIVNGDGQSFEFWDNLRLPVERYTLVSSLHYDLHEKVRFFFEGTYAKTKSANFFQPVEDPLNFGQAPISIDNAFLPSDVRAAMENAGIDSFGLNKIWTQFGRRSTDSERDTFQVTFGFEGNFADTWSYQLHYSHGENEETTQQHNNRLQAEFLRSLDSVLDPVTGQPVCRENAGVDPANRTECLPLNPFGVNTADPAAVEFSRIDTVRKDKNDQRVLGGNVTGDLFDPFGAGNIAVAAGFEYREESSGAFPSAIQQEGKTLLPEQEITTGSFKVKEIFGEGRVPLLSGQPFVDQLAIEGAFRTADYDTIGTVTSWSFGGDWAPLPDIRFRVVRSRAIRAPNIGELFSPQFGNFQFFQDPCDSTLINNGTQFRAENCETILGLDPATFNAPTNGRSPFTTGGGNPNLMEEEANTWTFGAVFTPTFLPEFSASIDYWDIDLDDAIVTLGGGTITRLCVDLPNVDNRFCNLVERDPVTRGIVNVIDTEINAGAIKTSGVDFQVNYSQALSSIMSNLSGTIDFNVVGTWVETRKFFGDPVNTDNFREAAGFAVSPGAPLPDWRFLSRTSYRNGPLLVSWQMQFISGLKRSDLDSEDFLDISKTSPKTIHDLAVTYEILEDVRVRGAVNNLFSTNPPSLFGAFVERGAGGIYPNLGRTFFFGATVDF